MSSTAVRTRGNRGRVTIDAEANRFEDSDGLAPCARDSDVAPASV